MDIKVLVIIALIFVCSSYCRSTAMISDDDKQYITAILEEVPEDERKQFVIHQLYKGYILNHPDDIAISVPEETTHKLYELFLTNYKITPTSAELFDKLCFPSGECVDTDDPGAYP